MGRNTFTEQDLKLMQERIQEKRGTRKIKGTDITITEPLKFEKPKGLSKYRNTKLITPDGAFDSVKEHKHWQTLQLLLKDPLSSGVVKVDRQVSFDLVVNDILICKYVADFVVHHLNGTREIQDVKSDITRKNRAYRIKCKLMWACHGFRIVEV